MKTKNEILLKYGEMREMHKRLSKVICQDHTISSANEMKKIGHQLTILEWIIND